jgi:hypothetical protein
VDNFYNDKKNAVMLKLLIFLILLPFLMHPVFAQSDYYKVIPSDIGTLNVGISTIPENPQPGEVVKFKIDFINPKTERIQEHIDYKFTLQREGTNVFGPIPLTHTSTGSVTIPVEIIEPGTYFGIIEFEGILFQPIPVETLSFTLPIAQAQNGGNGATPENGGGCLIATATFDSELSPQVQQLRELRDNVVLNTKSGFAFMTAFNQFYYSFSPTIADMERENFVFKESVKIVLTPLLTSLSILNYLDIDSEEDILGYGIGIILLNIGMYFAFPAIAILKWYKPRIQ